MVLTATPNALPRFALFGWVSPPLDQTTTSRYLDMKDLGFNLAVLAWDDTGYVEDNRARLAVTGPLGIGNLMVDNRLDSIFVSRPETWPLADSLVDDYRSDPAFTGWYLGDEPGPELFGRLGEWYAILRERDPYHPAWNSLRGRMTFGSHAAYAAYIQAFVDSTHPAVLCNSQYDFHDGWDAHQLVENVSTLATIAHARGIPFWGIIQEVEHWVFRPVTDGMLRWQIAQWMVYGASGIGYFTYWTPAPDPYYDWQPALVEWGSGTPTATYDTVQVIDRHLAPIGNVLAGADWLIAQYAGSVPAYGVPFSPNGMISAVSGRAALGFFADSTMTPLVLVANSDSLSARTITLTLAGGRRAWGLRDDGSWAQLFARPDGRLSVTLAAGDFLLLRLSGVVSPLPADVPPSAGAPVAFAVSPNPARGDVRFAFASGDGPARIALYDLSGRRVWARDLEPGATSVRWDGDDARGGRAPAGVYLARLERGGAAQVRRVAWLGAR